jgi:NADH-quinone oxidoreductase subunit A
METPLWTLPVFFGASVAVVCLMLGLSYILGQRHQSPAKDFPFESGVLPVGSARLRLNVRFYFVAMFFLIFDLETVYLFAWAVAAREAGWPGYFEALLFALILFAGLVYLWRNGALESGNSIARKERG